MGPTKRGNDMAFKDLSTAEMVNLFSPWVNEKTTRAEFASIEELSGLVGQVERAYRGVLAVAAPATTSPEVSALSEEEIRVDGQHDSLARAIALALQSQRARALGAEPIDMA